MKKESTNVNVIELITTGLWIAVVTVITMAVVIPIPFTQGYVNLGDAAVFLGVYLLGRKNGTVAAGIGSGLADLLLGYSAFAPFTLVIKAGMAFIFGTFLKASAGKIDKESKKIPLSRILGIGTATLLLAGGYYFAEWVITGNKVAPLVSVPWNILQGAVGGGLALLLIVALGSIRMPKGGKKQKVAEAEVVEAEVADSSEKMKSQGEDSQK
ncbi:MAG: ECF transporter S component [Clostridia bacterium]|nr:ECF transporter S component [Clostridia bacterium]